MNKKIYLLILGLLIISINSAETETDTDTENENEPPTNKTDAELCEEKLQNKDECFKVKLSSDDKQCCFYITNNSTDGDGFKGCALKLTDEEMEEYKKEENYTIKEECNGKLITTSILVLLALLFL
jgi:hypothetical protein